MQSRSKKIFKNSIFSLCFGGKKEELLLFFSRESREPRAFLGGKSLVGNVKRATRVSFKLQAPSSRVFGATGTFFFLKFFFIVIKVNFFKDTLNICLILG